MKQSKMGKSKTKHNGNATQCNPVQYKKAVFNLELTRKCKLKCHVKPMKDPLGISPSKGNQGTAQGKEKILRNRTHDLHIRSTVTLPTELRGQTEKVGDDLHVGGKLQQRESKGMQHDIHQFLN